MKIRAILATTALLVASAHAQDAPAAVPSTPEAPVAPEAAVTPEVLATPEVAAAPEEEEAPLSYIDYLIQANLAKTLAGEDDGAMKPLILGGTEVPVGQKTYTVGLRETATGKSFCGGSLITKKHVLTAAHCDGNINYVAVGTHYLDGSADGERIAVARRIKHPNYNGQTNSNDFLVLELAKASRFTPVALTNADADIVAGKWSTVMGWGTTSEGGSQSNKLLSVNVKLLDNTVCAKKLKIDKTMVCAGGEKGKDSCQGDSGGPLVVNKGGKDVLVGVVSWGEGCGRLNKPGVYARVSTARSWISQTAQGVQWS